MGLYWISISLTIVANIGYHLSIKAVNPNIHPLFSLALSYLVSAITCVVVMILMVSQAELGSQWRYVNWATVTLGMSIVLLEVGFLLAYRAGWNISVAALYCNVVVGLILLPIGLYFFREKLSLVNGLGVVLSLIGLCLIGLRT